VGPTTSGNFSFSSSRNVITVETPAGNKQQQRLQGRRQATGTLAAAGMSTTVYSSNSSDAIKL